jgi:hypothetical protein
MAQEDEDYVKSLEQKYGIGDSARSSDVANLAGKNPEDRQAYMDALDAQYKQRAGNTPNQGSSGGSSNQPPAQAWNQSQSLFPDWYGELMKRNLDMQQQQQAENKQRADTLYSTLSQRAGQSLAVDANDPTIKAQTDAYRNEQTRAQRDYLSNLAESSGPWANLRGEQRMAAEKTGQAVGGFQSQLLGRELGARRDEIAQALNAQGALLSGDQQRALQGQLASMDQAISEANAKTGANSVANQFALGQGQLALGNRSLDTSNDQFLRELALRAWDLNNQNDYRWSTL